MRRPASMEAAIRSDRFRARRLSRRMALGLAAATLLYLGAVSLPESINPLQALVPKAFTFPGLVQLSVAAAFFNGVVFLQGAELIALDRTRSLSLAQAAASAGRIAVAVPSGILRSWTVPFSFLIGGLIRWVSFSRILRSAYQESSTESRRGAVTGSDDEGFRPHPGDPWHPGWFDVGGAD